MVAEVVVVKRFPGLPRFSVNYPGIRRPHKAKKVSVETTDGWLRTAKTIQGQRFGVTLGPGMDCSGLRGF